MQSLPYEQLLISFMLSEGKLQNYALKEDLAKVILQYQLHSNSLLLSFAFSDNVRNLLATFMRKV